MPVVRRDRWQFWGIEEADLQGIDATHALGAEGWLFLGGFDATAVLAKAYNLNRSYDVDTFNPTATLELRAAL